MVETSGKPELELYPENVTELPQYHDKLSHLLLMDEQRKFLEKKATPDKDAVKVLK